MFGLPQEVLGPLGALVLALAVIAGLVKFLSMLWKTHLEADADDRAQRDKAIALLEVNLEATQRMARAWEERNKRDAARTRKGDP